MNNNQTIDMIIKLEEQIVDLKKDCIKLCDDIGKEIREIKEMTRKILGEEVKNG